MTTVMILQSTSDDGELVVEQRLLYDEYLDCTFPHSLIERLVQRNDRALRLADIEARKRSRA